MNELLFVRDREPDWQRLNFLLLKAEGTLKSLTAHEFLEFVRLYRSASRDLSLARSQSANLELIAFLNDLLGRAYGVIYRKPRRALAKVLSEAFFTGARTIRKRWAFLVASVSVFLAGVGGGALVLETRPELRAYVVGAEMEELFDHWKRGEFDERSPSESMTMYAMYSSNNPMVSIMMASMAAGTFGLTTVFQLWMNGEILGALASDMAGVGKLDHLLVSVAPHGATEITGMLVAGAAGFTLGWALIVPGRRSRGEALREAGKDAFALALMAIVMMFLAAPVEAFFSFNPNVPAGAKVAFAALCFTGWLLYWGFAGRQQLEHEQGQQQRHEVV